MCQSYAYVFFYNFKNKWFILKHLKLSFDIKKCQVLGLSYKVGKQLKQLICFCFIPLVKKSAGLQGADPRPTISHNQKFNLNESTYQVWFQKLQNLFDRWHETGTICNVLPSGGGFLIITQVWCHKMVRWLMLKDTLVSFLFIFSSLLVLSLSLSLSPLFNLPSFMQTICRCIERVQ